MPTYRDMTFCYSYCTRTACARHRSHVPYNAAASWADFSQECQDYTEDAEPTLWPDLNGDMQT